MSVRFCLKASEMRAQGGGSVDCQSSVWLSLDIFNPVLHLLCRTLAIT